jgi:hypothetical protein
MKKILLLAATIFYMASSIGATMHLHYCMGKVIERSMFASREAKCGGCDMEKSDADKEDCCKDEVQSLRNDTDQIHSQPISFSVTQVAQPAPLVYVENFFVLTPSRLEAPVSHAPPRSLLQPHYLLHRKLLI